MDKETMSKAREAFIKSVVSLYKQGTLSKDQALNIVDKHEVSLPDDEKEAFRKQIRSLLG